MLYLLNYLFEFIPCFRNIEDIIRNVKLCKWRSSSTFFCLSAVFKNLFPHCIGSNKNLLNQSKIRNNNVRFLHINDFNLPSTSLKSWTDKFTNNPAMQSLTNI